MLIDRHVRAREVCVRTVVLRCLFLLFTVRPQAGGISFQVHREALTSVCTRLQATLAAAMLVGVLICNRTQHLGER